MTRPFCFSSILTAREKPSNFFPHAHTSTTQFLGGFLHTRINHIFHRDARFLILTHRIRKKNAVFMDFSKACDRLHRFRILPLDGASSTPVSNLGLYACSPALGVNLHQVFLSQKNRR
ncbi:uncharacterized protein LOC103522398 [Diaphorina citri]|uniref:Uncharacterized protein LOC103522398 n=1 Tax=Diaphorina citri TaxID=121845 RepID=A0A1S3DPB2_DIACI|nr:uncharacterized protein LOC103522398 [Diaphorina citri]